MSRILFVIVLTSFFYYACTTNNKSSSVEFYYYPDKNVYYNIATEKYYYSLNGGKTWDSLNLSNENDPPTLGDKVIISSSSSDVWRQNSQHRKEYGGTVYNIDITDTAMIAGTSTNEVTERRIIRKPVYKPKPRKQESSKPEKKTVKEFFKDIFGKKEKK